MRRIRSLGRSLEARGGTNARAGLRLKMALVDAPDEHFQCLTGLSLPPKWDWELLTNSMILNLKSRGAFLRAAMEDTSPNYLIATPSYSGSMSDEEILARIIEMQEELKDFTWTGSVFPEEQVEGAAPEPPRAGSGSASSENMNPKLDSEAPADGGGRRAEPLGS